MVSRISALVLIGTRLIFQRFGGGCSAMIAEPYGSGSRIIPELPVPSKTCLSEDVV